MENEEDSRTLDATDAAEIRFLVDAETLGWLEMESARTGISLEKIASAMLRKACSEMPQIGVPSMFDEKEICPACGKDMVVTTEAFEINGDAVRGIPHLLCRSCGEVTFTPEQLDMVFGYRTAQKQLKAAKRPA